MDFKQYLEQQKLADYTIKTHINKVASYKQQYGNIGYDIDSILKKIDNEPTISTRKSMAGSLSKYLQYKKKDTKKLAEYIFKQTAEFQKDKDKRTAETKHELPTLKNLKGELNTLYEKGDWRSFVILYLMVNYQVRNKDLIATVVNSKRETNSTDNFIVVNKSQATYVRNDYKTAFKYGTKTNIIKNAKFMYAINQIGYVLKSSDNVDRVIKKATAGLGGITEGTIAKIVLSQNNTMNGLKKVSKNRGTDPVTLIESYNIT
jgi:hypothetical protein